MSELNSEDTTTLIDYPRVLLEQVEAVLRHVGLDLPAQVSQVALFILSTSISALLFWRYRKKSAQHPITSLVSAIGTLLVSLGIMLSWVSEVIWPMPDVLQGNVVFSGLSPAAAARLRVDLLDVRERQITVEGGWVDSETGRFAAAYEKRFGDRPYYLQITAPGCTSLDMPLSYSRLRAGGEFTVNYQCNGQR